MVTIGPQRLDVESDLCQLGDPQLGHQDLLPVILGLGKVSWSQARFRDFWRRFSISYMIQKIEYSGEIQILNSRSGPNIFASLWIGHCERKTVTPALTGSQQGADS